MSSIILRAIKPEKNMNRLYELSLQKGLCGSWCILIRNARYGNAGHQRVYPFKCLKDAMKFMSGKVRNKLNTKYELYSKD